MPSAKERIVLVCVFCKKNFERLPCQIKGSSGIKRGKFCSKACMENNRRNGSEIKCMFCGSVFYRRFGEQGDTKSPFCSIRCYKKHRIGNAKKTTYLKKGAVHRHILVAERALGRKLKTGEVVHHINENKHDNSIKNLAVLPSQKVHAMVHFGKINFDKYRLTNLIK